MSDISLEGEIAFEAEEIVRITWDRLSIQQVKFLRSIDPKLAAMPISETWDLLKNRDEWLVSDLWMGRGMEVTLKARKEGLVAVRE